MTFCQYVHQALTLCRGRSRISREEGANPKGVHQPIIQPKFPEHIDLKMKTSGLRGKHSPKVLLCRVCASLWPFLPFVSVCTYSCPLHLFIPLHLLAPNISFCFCLCPLYHCPLCHMIKDRVTVVKVMPEFIPKRIHQTHTGSFSLVN